MCVQILYITAPYDVTGVSNGANSSIYNGVEETYLVLSLVRLTALATGAATSLGSIERSPSTLTLTPCFISTSLENGFYIEMG